MYVRKMHQKHLIGAHREQLSAKSSGGKIGETVVSPGESRYNGNQKFGRLLPAKSEVEGMCI